ncbi:MAG: fructosamine kinase family protein [Cryomorphaceae bacterium]|nr:fructosamine kinase family protein [Cryomorphaceae bacterium]
MHAPIDIPIISKSARWTPLSGGSINSVFRTNTTDGQSVVVKINNKLSGIFLAEEKGLQLLKPHIQVPEVISQGKTDKGAYLVLQDLGGGSETKTFQQSLGEQLACMHRIPQQKCGLDHDNFIGTLHQKNDWEDHWVSFFIRHRLQPQVNLATRAGLLNADDEKSFERLYAKLPKWLPNEPNSLLHGDLWGGNVHCGADGKAYFIDPAVYIGHREMELSMTQLFGGFADDFYEAYDANYPLEPGWRERVNLHNLYPNLVHLNLFGSGYVGAVRAALRRFS